jgi:hypothetical protein
LDINNTSMGLVTSVGTGAIDSLDFAAQTRFMLYDYARQAVWGWNDTLVVDTSKIGVWLIANTGGSAGSGASEAVIRDILGDSVPAYRVQIYDSGMTMIREFIDDAPHTADYGNVAGGTTGDYACSLYVMKIDLNEDTTALMGAYIRFYEMDSITGVGLVGPSASDGYILTDLGSTDPDYFLAAVWVAGYTPDSSRQVIVAQSGGSNDTLYLTQVPATLPDSAGLCRVHGILYTAFGQVINNAMVAVAPTNNLAATAGNKILLPTEKVVPVNSQGQFEFYLEKSSSVVYPHADSTYHYKISVFIPAGPQSDGGVVWKEVNLQDETGYFTVPDSSSYSIEAILGATYTPE